MSDFIVYRSLCKSFGRKEVLKGVDLAIREGETVVILGGSGSGKSVLIRHTIGLHKPDSGEILVDGTEISGLSEEELMPVRRKVGMLFQGGALFDSMDVFENIAFSLREHTEMEEEQIEDRVSEVLGLVELADVESLMPSDLSGGMRKRVALARAIALSPRGILYDEPTTGLDPITADAINRLIRNLQAALHATSVVVTHDIASAFKVADRIAFLYDGRLEFVGTVAEAVASRDARLRDFLRCGATIGPS
ncbi:MAG TPA: ABC transporter ATP-binding protein [Candidatus Polarisedimenticolia bacterium]|nr:ABC transporter ATP-binding protein [Candidatus Polarisedimenticolia bacterium]